MRSFAHTFMKATYPKVLGLHKRWLLIRRSIVFSKITTHNLIVSKSHQFYSLLIQWLYVKTVGLSIFFYIHWIWSVIFAKVIVFTKKEKQKKILITYKKMKRLIRFSRSSTHSLISFVFVLNVQLICRFRSGDADIQLIISG